MLSNKNSGFYVFQSFLIIEDYPPIFKPQRKSIIMENQYDQTKKTIMEKFDGVIEDSEQIRNILKDRSKLSPIDLEFVKARIGNNKAINVALNGQISVIRLTEQTKKEEAE